MKKNKIIIVDNKKKRISDACALKKVGFIGGSDINQFQIMEKYLNIKKNQ